MSSERRTHKFINSWAQISIALEVVLHAILLVALIALILFAPPFVEMFSQYSAADHQAIAKELVQLNAGKWPLFVFLAIFIGVVSILFSHHIVGPAHQLNRVIGYLRDRKLDARLRFRKWDYLIDVQDGMNEVISAWSSDIQSIQESQKEALNLAKEIKGGSAGDGKAEQLEKKLQDIQKVLDSYKGLS